LTSKPSSHPTSFLNLSQVTFFTFTPYEPIVLRAKALPCSSAKALVFSAKVRAGASTGKGKLGRLGPGCEGRQPTRSPNFGGLQTIVLLMYAHVAKGPHQQQFQQHVEEWDQLLHLSCEIYELQYFSYRILHELRYIKPCSSDACKWFSDPRTSLRVLLV
jgi:hypothetical protein